ncbi:MAG: dihydrofolate reductase family protein [Pseudomonadota bacterium]
MSKDRRLSEPERARRPHFTLTVASSADGFIARDPTEPPQVWASAEEQSLFFEDVAAADWAVLGRNTHMAAERDDRRRIIFSTTISGWRKPTQIWLDPAGLQPADLPALVSRVAPLSRGLILGGTRVHDWFFAHDAIDEVHQTIEPIVFGAGLPMFTGASGEAPEKCIGRTGLTLISDTKINAGGTRYLIWTRGV